MKAAAYQNLAREGDVLKTCLEFLECSDIIHVRFNNMKVSSRKVSEKWEHFFLKLPEHQEGAPDIFVFLPILLNLWDIPNQTTETRSLLIAIAVECKRPKVKKLRDAQGRWRKRWEDRGGVYLEVRKLEDLIEGLKRYIS